MQTDDYDGATMATRPRCGLRSLPSLPSCTNVQQLLCRVECRLGQSLCEPALLHTATCAHAPDVSHGGCARCLSKFSSGASRYPQDRAPSQCCVRRGVSAAAVTQVATSVWCRFHSPLLKQMPNFEPVLDRISKEPSSPRSLRKRCVRMRIRRRRTRSQLASLHSVLETHGT
jgi:hypothetical protein